MEMAIMAGAALLALIGAYFATNLTNGVDVVAQVKKAEKSRAKMKKALTK
jgi:cell division protein FtsB